MFKSAIAAILAGAFLLPASAASGQEEKKPDPAPGEAKPSVKPAKDDFAEPEGGPDPKSILANGGFEEGKTHPDGWHEKDFDGFDGLTCFWEKRPDGKGMAVRVDTWVLLTEVYPRWELMKKLPPGERPAAAPKTEPVDKQKYQTVAGNDGVHVISAFVPVMADWEYRITVDVFSKKTGVKVFTDGYIVHRGRDRSIYRNQKALGEEPAEQKFLGRWHRYTWLFHPTRRKDGSPLSPPPEKMRVKLFAYWPPGEVWFDNVSIVPAEKREKPTPDDIERPEPRKPEEKGEGPGEKGDR
jgi:hypothetical protein